MIAERPPVTANLVLPIIIKPALKKVEELCDEAAADIKMALLQAESSHPGLILEFVTALASRVIPDINMTKALITLQGSVTDSDEYKCHRNGEVYVELNKKSYNLKKILSRLPSEINDRKTFLETIKEIASAMKKLLDCLSQIINLTTSHQNREALEDRKRDFIKYSKKFSDKLKDFFKEGGSQGVFTGAAQLINQTYAIQLTVKQAANTSQ